MLKTTFDVSGQIHTNLRVRVHCFPFVVDLWIAAVVCIYVKTMPDCSDWWVGINKRWRQSIIHVAFVVTVGTLKDH